MSKRVVEIVENIFKDYSETSDLELVNVSFVKEGQNRFLRIMIEKDEGISLKDCQEVSRFINNRLDEQNIIKEKYFLEVTSPGVERELYGESDYKKFTGEQIEVKLYAPVEGRKKYKGELKGFTKSYLKVLVEDRVFELPRNKIAKVNLFYDFEEGKNV